MEENQHCNNSGYYTRLILAIAIWAGLYHVAALATKFADIYLIAFVRYVITAVVFIFFHKYKTGRFVPRLNSQQWVLIFVLGLVGICMYNLFFFSAEELISGNIVAILYAFAPCITTIISAYLFKVKLNWLSKLGVVVALVGSICVVNYATPECQAFFCPTIFQSIGKGEVYGILATFAFAAYSVICKYTAQKGVASITVNTYASIFGGSLLGVFVIFKSDFTVIPNLSWQFWAVMFYISILATVLAYFWYIEAIIHLGVFNTVVFQNTLPLQTILIGYIFFHNQISMGELACGFLVLAGVYITNYALNVEK